MTLPSSDAYLFLEANGRTVALTGGRSWAIGRSDGCAVVLSGRSVSRLHALVQRLEEGGYCLIDLGSRNGSYVNGRRVSVPMPLADGDVLVLGDQRLRFHCAAQPRPPAAEPQERDVPTTALLTQSLLTVAVMDIRGFTRLTRSVNEELLSRTIGSWFLMVGQVTARYGSWAQQYIGDAVMAVWIHQDPAAVAGDVVDVLRAVCEVAEATSRLGRELSLAQPLEIGVGVNTGNAIVGNSDFTALGDTVTAAFRYESATRTLGKDVALGVRPLEALGAESGAAHYFERRVVELKGYDQPSPVWATSFPRLREYLRHRP